MDAHIRTFSLIMVLLLAGCSTGSEPPTQIESSSDTAPIVQTLTTSSTGQVTFTDPATQEAVTVTVVDQAGQNLPGVEVVYQHGVAQVYEAFMVLDPTEGLIAADFFLHNSDHQIQATDGIMTAVNPDKTEALSGWISDMKLISKTTYLETIPGSEMRNRMDNLVRYGKVLAFFIGKFPGVGRFLSYISKGAMDPVTYLHENFIYSGRWDRYEIYEPEYSYTDVVFVQSQPPVMQEPTVRTDSEQRTWASVLALDPTQYPEDYFKLPGMIDHTIFMAGASDFSDVTYHVTVLDQYNSTVSMVDVPAEAVCVEDVCTPTEVELGRLSSGEYTLQVYATDEVGNDSETVSTTFSLEFTSQENPPVDVPPQVSPGECSSQGYQLNALHDFYEAAVCTVQSQDWGYLSALLHSTVQILDCTQAADGSVSCGNWQIFDRAAAAGYMSAKISGWTPPGGLGSDVFTDDVSFFPFPPSEADHSMVIYPHQTGGPYENWDLVLGFDYIGSQYCITDVMLVEDE